MNIKEKPILPSNTILVEADLRKKCDECGSSLRRRWLFKVLGCFNPKCKNYLDK